MQFFQRTGTQVTNPRGATVIAPQAAKRHCFLPPAAAAELISMGAARARRWKLLPFHTPPPAPCKAKHRPPTVPATPSPESARAEEEVPREFLCPILGEPMADPVILPSGRTYERACVQACAELSVCPTGVAGEPSAACGVAIPNDALREAIRTWCALSGRTPPAAPSAAAAREAVLLAVPTPAAAARSSSNLSCSSRASAASMSSSSVSSSEITAVEMEIVRGREMAKEAESLRDDVAEEEVAVKAVEDGDEEEVEAAMAVLRRTTRESAARRRALCAPRLLAALRCVLLSPRHTGAARADAAAALANLSLEPENRVPIVRGSAVPALVGLLSSRAAAAPEACEHAAGALFGLALHEGNRAAIGVLGAVPPLLALLTTRDHAPRARRDAGMALYHLSLAAVNQSKLARSPGAAKNLLAIASDSTEPSPIRRLALMAVCNVAACAEGRTALMDANAVATVSAILSDDTHRSDLEEWCVAALYGMGRGSPRFRALARAAGADRPLILIAERAHAGIHKEMAHKALRAMLGLGDNNDGDHADFSNSEATAAAASSHRQRRSTAGAPRAGGLLLPHRHKILITGDQYASINLGS